MYIKLHVSRWVEGLTFLGGGGGVVKRRPDK